jgi:hypothetical protein
VPRMTTRHGHNGHPPMTLSLGQAAKEVGLDKSTLSRAIKRGRLSAQRTDSGGYAIDPAELFRVFPPASQKPPALSPPIHTPTEALLENRELRIKLEAAELRLREKDEELRDLRRRLDAESDERRKLTLRLLAPPPPLSPTDSQARSVQTEAQHPVPPPAFPPEAMPIVPAKKRGVWAWLVGKS